MPDRDDLEARQAEWAEDHVRHAEEVRRSARMSPAERDEVHGLMDLGMSRRAAEAEVRRRSAGEYAQRTVWRLQDLRRGVDERMAEVRRREKVAKARFGRMVTVRDA